MDAKVKLVIDNIQGVVSSEGGSVEFVGMSAGKLTVRYNKGRNDECPECVPDHELVNLMLKNSASIYAPSVTHVELL